MCSSLVMSCTFAWPPSLFLALHSSAVIAAELQFVEQAMPLSCTLRAVCLSCIASWEAGSVMPGSGRSAWARAGGGADAGGVAAGEREGGAGAEHGDGGGGHRQPPAARHRERRGPQQGGAPGPPHPTQPLPPSTLYVQSIGRSFSCSAWKRLERYQVFADVQCLREYRPGRAPISAIEVQQ